MKLRVVLERPLGDLEDLEWVADPGACVADLARSIVRDDPRFSYDGDEFEGELTLEVRATDGSGDVEIYEGKDILEDLNLASGVQIRVVPEAHAPKMQVALISVMDGPDEGVRLLINRGTSTIGRDPSCDIVLADPTVSKVHARIHAAADRVEIVDLNSANGLMLGDALVPRADISDGTPVTLGATTLVVHMEAEVEPPSPHIQSVLYTRPPRVEARFPSQELEGADLPVPREKQPFPWLMMIAPIAAGAAMFAVTRSPLSLVFVALSPIMMLGNYVTTSGRARAELRRGIARFEEQLERLAGRLDKARESEVRVRLAETPSLAEVNAAVQSTHAPLWTRRPEHWSFMFLRLGVGEAPSRVSVKEPQGRDRALPDYEERFEALVSRYRTVPDVPVVEDLEEAGALGIAGSPQVTAAYARGLVAQIAGLHSPTEVVVMGVTGASWGEHLEDLKWLPHAAAAESMFGIAFGATNQAASNVVAALEEIIHQRSGGKDEPKPLGALHEDASALKVGGRVGAKDTPGEGYTAPIPAIVVVIADDAPVDKARLIQVAERAARLGIFPVWLTAQEKDLPAACRTYVTFDDAGHASAHYVRLGYEVPKLQVEVFRKEHLKRFALSLSRVVDVSALPEDVSDIPTTVTLLDLIGREVATDPGAVIDRWSQNGSLVRTPGVTPPGYTPRLRALVGQASHGALHIDLRGQGPHALVGGTTGAGKSEFLQAWVLGMAVEYSPQRATFLFVDYKGGSAFAECTTLPHCVGLVTDLSPHLVRRALISLRAELHYREELFNRKKAKDILDLEQRGDPECPPALVIVIDEFAALVSEVPDFVDGVVDVAQRGRSLGIHLIMATQRPAGVIKDNLRANTNLRIALRMADESDSTDVIGVKTAAQFPPELPGRGAMKSGPGRLTTFQSAYTGARSFEQQISPHPDVASLVFGPPVPWERPKTPAPAHDSPVGPTDQQRLVSTVIDGAARAKLPAPRRPWMDELPELLTLEDLLGGPDAKLPMGLIDVPQRQKRLPMSFEPDSDQNLVLYGASGSGKTAALRTLAVAAGFSTDPVHIYAIDAGGSGLRMLDVLPHVGAVVLGEDSERVMRLMRMMRTEIERRTVKYGALDAASLSEYRINADAPEEPRIVILVDNFPSFRAEYESVPGRSEAYAALQYLMAEGRSVGVHAAITADRGPSVNNATQATIQKRMVLRMADADGYSVLGVPRDVLTAESTAGRGVLGEHEFQVAVWQGLAETRVLAAALREAADTMPAASREPAPPVGALPAEYSIDDLPATVDDMPVLGLSDIALAPHPFDPSGLLLVAGGPESGRSTALQSLVQSVRRWRADTQLFYLGARKSALKDWPGWHGAAQESSALEGFEKALEDAVVAGVPVVLVVESATDFADSSSEMDLTRWVKRARAGDLLVIAESDSLEWGGYGGLKNELRNARRGVVLQPETADGDAILKTVFPRVVKTEFGPGRGLWAASGRVCRVQLPMPSATDPAPPEPPPIAKADKPRRAPAKENFANRKS